jgi:O-methyltransferase involved in polyketide biosynthesis
VQRTLLITLYAKALDNRSEHSILKDKKADEIVRSIDFHFENTEGFGNRNILVIRAKQFDDWVNEFLGSNPKGVVLNLGCGLDPRISRINPSPSVRWFDLDFHDVIKVRRNFFSDRDGCEMIESSITETRWLEKIPKDRPTMIVADGVLEYLSEEEVSALFNKVTDHFRSGQIAFDIMNSAAVERGRSRLKDSMGAEHKWAVDDIRDVDKLDPKLRRIDVVSVFGLKYISKLQLKYRLAYGFINLIPNFRNMIRLLRYEF